MSGSDCVIHLYVRTGENKFEEFRESYLNFPGKSPILTMEIENIQESYRFVNGRENGKCEITELKINQEHRFFQEKDIVRYHEITLFSPISRAILFRYETPKNELCLISEVSANNLIVG